MQERLQQALPAPLNIKYNIEKDDVIYYSMMYCNITMECFDTFLPAALKLGCLDCKRAQFRNKGPSTQVHPQCNGCIYQGTRATALSCHSLCGLTCAGLLVQVRGHSFRLCAGLRMLAVGIWLTLSPVYALGVLDGFMRFGSALPFFATCMTCKWRSSHVDMSHGQNS